MSLLLDTHVLLWALYDSSKLSLTAKEAIPVFFMNTGFFRYSACFFHISTLEFSYIYRQ